MFLREVFEWPYEEFIRELQSPTRGYTEFQTSLLYLTSAITDPKSSLKAIQTSLDRIDGRQPQKIDFIMPKFYVVYPNATEVEGGEAPTVVAEEEPEEEPVPDPDIKGLRAEIKRLSREPRGYIDQVLLAASLISDGKPSINKPKVKTVAAATLYQLSRRSMMALDTLLEEVEGKVVEKIQPLGGDVYVKNFATVAPAGAVLNKDGVYQVEHEQMTNVWGMRLSEGGRV